MSSWRGKKHPLHYNFFKIKAKMNIQLNTYMQSFGDKGFIAWIDHPKSFKMVVQGGTPEETAKELLISLRVKMARIFGVDINTIEERAFHSDKEFGDEISKALKETGKKQLQFQLA